MVGDAERRQLPEMEEISLLRLLQVMHHHPGRRNARCHLFHTESLERSGCEMIHQQIVAILPVEQPVFDLGVESGKRPAEEGDKRLCIPFLDEELGRAEVRDLFGEVAQREFTRAEFRRGYIDECKAHDIVRACQG